MALKHLILARLLRGPAHGYEMHHEPLQPLHPDFGVTEAHIYASLRSLEKDGYVRHRRIRRRPFPERIRYAVTSKGKRYLLAWAGSPDQEPQAPLARALWDPFAVRLYVSRALKLGNQSDSIRSVWNEARQRIDVYGRLLSSKSLRRSPIGTLLLLGLCLEKAGLGWIKSLPQATRKGGRSRGSVRRRVGRSTP